MAETLTIDPTPKGEVVETPEGVELTSDEQDSLAVGEQLGEDGKEAVPPEAQVETEQEEVLPEESEESSEELSEAASLISSASDEYYNNDGKLSAETIEKFSSMSSKDLVEAYMQVQNNLPQGTLDDDVADISDAVVLVNYILGNDTILEGSGHEDISSGNTAINNQIYG